MTDLLIFSSLIAYLFFLFLIAKFFESKKYSNLKNKVLFDKLVYIFGFGAYCTTWTYYGSIEGVTTSGVKFLTVYLGPALSSIVWALLLRKVITLKERYGITNIPDLINVLYNINNNKTISTIVTLFFTVGLIPYIALQLKSVTRTSHYVLNLPVDRFDFLDICIGISFIAFATYFGNKNIQESRERNGLSAIIAVESLMKLLGILVVGIFVTFFKFDGFSDLLSASKELLELKKESGSFADVPKMSSWISITFLSFFAFLFLPRQFHMGVVENRNKDDVYTASWAVPLYLFVINIFIIPIAIFGMFYTNNSLPADLYLLGIPFQAGLDTLTIIVFLGGYSAAAGMVVLEVVTLSTMITNSIILPYLQKIDSSLTTSLVQIKRLVMIVLIVVSYVYMKQAGNTAALISMGLISFSCVFQLAPTIIGGLLWKGAHKQGALASILAGVSIWLYTLFIPAFLKSSPSTIELLNNGPFGISFLRPYSLFGISSFDPVTHSLFWSTLISIPLYVFFSIRGSRINVDRSYANTEFSLQDKIDDLSIDSADFKLRLSTMLKKFFSNKDIAIIWTDLEEVLPFENDNIDYEHFTILINKLQVTLFEIIGAIAANVEIKALLTDEELKIFECDNVQVLQKQIIAKEKLYSMSELTSGLAHELINPLNIAINASDLLNSQIVDNEVKEDMLKTNEMVSRNLSRTNEIVRKMLTMTQSTDFITKEAELIPLIENVVLSTRKLADESYNMELNIEVEVSSHVRPFKFSYDEIERVFKYLLDNSLNSLDKKNKILKGFKPTITIKLEYFLNMLNIHIVDNGTGIPEEMIKKVLSPFFTSKPTGQGNLGLGLSRANDIIMAHRGILEVESKVDEWTKVTISIPY